MKKRVLEYSLFHSTTIIANIPPETTFIYTLNHYNHDINNVVMKRHINVITYNNIYKQTKYTLSLHNIPGQYWGKFIIYYLRLGEPQLKIHFLNPLFLSDHYISLIHLQQYLVHIRKFAYLF